MRVFFIGIMLFLTSCDSNPDYIRFLDKFLFEHYGSTLFNKSRKLTTKELHFNAGKLLGTEVIVEGQILSIDKYKTHLVINDETGRMLVVLTQIENVDNLLENQKIKTLKVLGTVDRGNKGLPYILAKAINLEVVPKPKKM